MNTIFYIRKRKFDLCSMNVQFNLAKHICLLDFFFTENTKFLFKRNKLEIYYKINQSFMCFTTFVLHFNLNCTVFLFVFFLLFTDRTASKYFRTFLFSDCWKQSSFHQFNIHSQFLILMEQNKIAPQNQD